jgi:hypothetical protein
VIALAISSPSACCSRSFSLHTESQDHPQSKVAEYDIHCVIHFINAEIAMNICHSLTRFLHGQKRLSIDVCRLDRINLLFQGCDLSRGLFKGVLVLLFTSKCGFRGYPKKSAISPEYLEHCVKSRCNHPSAEVSLSSHITHIRTILVGADILSSYRILLIHLVLQMPFSLLQHLQL